MILIFGGTSEGRIAAQVCRSSSKPVFYSTKSEGQQIDGGNITRLYGAMTSRDIIDFCQEKEIKLIVDAAHPFAEMLHTNIVDAASLLHIPVIRFERERVLSANEHNVINCHTISEAVDEIHNKGYRRVLALTGVKSAKVLSTLLPSTDVILRIMNRKESWQEIGESGFPQDKVIIYGDSSHEDRLRNYSADVILCKQSGESGKEREKRELAKSLGIDIIIVQRPKSLDYKSVVYGQKGLRLAIERAIPDLFELSTGFTTGSCATAAAVVALRAILKCERSEYVDFVLPCEERVTMEVTHVECNENWAKATIIKDGGDDPDVTNGARITALVRLDRECKNIKIEGGEGVGRVTLPGLGLEVGQSAINPTPRRMIEDNILSELRAHNMDCGVEVTISVEGGKNIAQKTFNKRLGIVDGISILGTSGIVYPFSREAFLDSISKHIDVIKALKEDRIVINSGGKSERFLKVHFADIPRESFVQYGNMIGDTLELCAKAELKQVILGVMIGKAVKLAQGQMDTHSRRGVMNREFLEALALRAACSEQTISAIRDITAARELWDIVPHKEHQFFSLLKEQCYDHCKGLMASVELKIVLVRDNGDIL